jgi:hypothetical protein
MTAKIICISCGTKIGDIKRDSFNDEIIKYYEGCFTCDCGGEANLVIVDE